MMRVKFRGEEERPAKLWEYPILLPLWLMAMLAGIAVMVLALPYLAFVRMYQWITGER